MSIVTFVAMKRWEVHFGWLPSLKGVFSKVQMYFLLCKLWWPRNAALYKTFWEDNLSWFQKEIKSSLWQWTHCPMLKVALKRGRWLCILAGIQVRQYLQIHLSNKPSWLLRVSYLPTWLEGAPETTIFKVLEDISFRVGLTTGSPSISPTLTAPKKKLHKLRESISFVFAAETKLGQELMQLLVRSPCDTEKLAQKDDSVCQGNLFLTFCF